MRRQRKNGIRKSLSGCEEKKGEEKMKSTTEIISLMEQEQWEAAAGAIVKAMETGGFDDTLAVLAATTAAQMGDAETCLQNIQAGLKYNSENYELYLMLGNYYADRNPDQAFLCYENSQYYCRKSGNADDLACIEKVKEDFLKGHEVAVKPYSFVILSYNTFELTRQCIESIRQNCDPDTYELILVDNASEDESVPWLREQSDIVLIENSENKGFPAGCNQGIAAAKPDNDIMLLNSDTIMMPNAMFTLRMGLYDSKRNGAAGSVSNHTANGQVIDHAYDTVEEYVAYAKRYNVPCDHPYEYKTWLVGFAILAKRTALEQVGLLDERFTPGCYEDNDLGLRFSKMGFRNVVCWNSFIYHFGSRSFDKNQKHLAVSGTDLANVNAGKFKEKWGINANYYTNARVDLMNLMRQDFERPIRVLEVGCGAGATLGRIQHLYPNAEVFGIELVEEVATLGAMNYNIICGNIEQMELPYEKESFDYIIFGDVLEHLIHPDEVLRKVRDYLKKDGHVLASIPNLMHAAVIYDLLHGRFPYEDAGIRDRTHMRFFTYYEILRLFEETGYQVDAAEQTNVRGATTEDFDDFFTKLLAIDGVADKQWFDAYQYLVSAAVQNG
jgi:GT2 family glycosyltransferase/trans-aconitate methyltransferase